MKGKPDTSKPNLPTKVNEIPVWKKPTFPNNQQFLKPIRLPGSQHRG